MQKGKEFIKTILSIFFFATFVLLSSCANRNINEQEDLPQNPNNKIGDNYNQNQNGGNNNPLKERNNNAEEQYNNFRSFKYDFRPGDVLTYNVKHTQEKRLRQTEKEENHSPPKKRKEKTQKSRIKLEGKLKLKVYRMFDFDKLKQQRPEKHIYLVSLRFSKLKLNWSKSAKKIIGEQKLKNVQKECSQEIFILLQENGNPLRLVSPNNLSKQTIGLWQTLVYKMFPIIMPEKKKNNWTSNETNLVGFHQVNYEGNANTVIRKIDRYKAFRNVLLRNKKNKLRLSKINIDPSGRLKYKLEEKSVRSGDGNRSIKIKLNLKDHNRLVIIEKKQSIQFKLIGKKHIKNPRKNLEMNNPRMSLVSDIKKMSKYYKSIPPGVIDFNENKLFIPVNIKKLDRFLSKQINLIKNQSYQEPIIPKRSSYNKLFSSIFKRNPGFFGKSNTLEYSYYLSGILFQKPAFVKKVDKIIRRIQNEFEGMNNHELIYKSKELRGHLKFLSFLILSLAESQTKNAQKVLSDYILSGGPFSRGASLGVINRIEVPSVQLRASIMDFFMKSQPGDDLYPLVIKAVGHILSTLNKNSEEFTNNSSLLLEKQPGLVTEEEVKALIKAVSKAKVSNGVDKIKKIMDEHSSNTIQKEGLKGISQFNSKKAIESLLYFSRAGKKEIRVNALKALVKQRKEFGGSKANKTVYKFLKDTLVNSETKKARMAAVEYFQMRGIKYQDENAREVLESVQNKEDSEELLKHVKLALYMINIYHPDITSSGNSKNIR